MPSVLFVCTANICRSPMAEAILRSLVRDDPEEWRIESAGTWGLPGYPAAAYTVEVLRERGIELKDHRSRIVTEDLLRQFNLILTMESGQKEALRVEFPGLASRVFLLSEFGGHPFDIEDPMGGSLSDFKTTAREIEALLQAGMPEIRRRASGG